MSVRIAPDALDAMMPMHLVLGADGRVASLGSTLARAAAERGVALAGAPFFEIAEVRRPAGVRDLAALREAAGKALRVTLGDDMRMTGVAVPSGAGALVNLSFGIDVVEAVARHGLTMADFAPTDPTTELLFLVEARAAAHRELVSMAARLDAARRDAEARAQTDALTGLPNRRAFDALLEGLAAAGAGYCMLGVDLDFFKEVNDRHGHAAGDAVLVAAAERMRAATRRDDVVARLGGDEFAVLLRGDVPAARLREVAAGLIEALERSIDLPEGGTAAISASIGIARSADLPDGDPDTVLAAADAALYRAKRGGRGRSAV